MNRNELISNIDKIHTTELGKERISRTENAIQRADIAVIITTAKADDTDLEIAKQCGEKNVPLIIIFNKADLEIPSENLLAEFAKFGETLAISSTDKTNSEKNISAFKEKIIKIVPEEFITPPSLLGDVLKQGEHAVFVVPIDIQAPKGRLILPQVQAIRDILDINAAVSLTQENTYRQTLENLKIKPDLVVCDSQVVDFVAKNTPDDVKLTTFSIVFARNKGDLQEFVKGGQKIEKLTPDDKILIAEACSHHPLNEDIGRVKIPNLLEKKLGFKPKIDFCAGKDFPENLQEYSLVIHCGGCMLTRREMLVRLENCKERNVSITNYGVAISFMQGVAERTIAPLQFC
jgi:[FeFe] hydrogenase H-cluster maturation GTPase HydF